MKESEKEAVSFWNLRTPLTVIVPPIEWEPLNAVGTFWGKGKDNMFSIKKLGPDYIAGYASMNHKLPFKTFEDANAVCYGMKKYVVDQALEGCNVIPYQAPSPAPVVLEWVEDELKYESVAHHAYYNGLIECYISASEDGKAKFAWISVNRSRVANMPEKYQHVKTDHEARAWCAEQITKIITPTPTMKP